MIRRIAMEGLDPEPGFRWRGGDVSRQESLTDGVFAIALALLALSSEVPRTWTDFVAAVREVPAFLACSAIFLWVWLEHYRFHRRFGLEDLSTTALNAGLILVILVYVYPLKYVLSPLLARLFGWDAPAEWGPPGSAAGLMLFYSGGFVAIFALLGGMYLHAWRLRERLALDETERAITRAALRGHALSLGVGVVSMVLALAGGALVPFSGLVYFLLGPLHGIHGWRAGVRIARVRERARAERSRADGATAARERGTDAGQA